MRVDIGESCLDFGNTVRIARDFGLRHQTCALAVSLKHDLDQAFGAIWRFLRQPSYAPARRNGDRAMLGRNIACDYAEQRRLAGAVAADQSDARAGGDARGRAFQQRAAGNADSQFVDHKHGSRLLAEGAARSNPRLHLSRSCAIRLRRFRADR